MLCKVKNFNYRWQIATQERIGTKIAFAIGVKRKAQEEPEAYKNEYYKN